MDELLPDDIVKHYGSGAELLLNPGVIREIDAYDLKTGIGIAAAIEDIAGENIGLVSGQEMAVDRVAGQHHLELLHPGRQGIELFGALEVLQQNIGSV